MHIPKRSTPPTPPSNTSQGALKGTQSIFVSHMSVFVDMPFWLYSRGKQQTAATLSHRTWFGIVFSYQDRQTEEGVEK